MDFKKTILYFALAIVGVMLWHAWQHDYPPTPVTSTNTLQQTNTIHPVNYAPSAYNQSSSPYQATPKTLAAALPQNKTITVKTDIFDAVINLQGGDLIDAKLLQYPVSLKQKNLPVQILNSNNDALYVAQSGLSVHDEKTVPKPIIYTASQKNYVLQDGKNKLVVTLTGSAMQGMEITKTFIFTRNNYAVNTAITLTNNTDAAWNGNIYNQITRRDIMPSGFASRAYNGAAVSTPNTPYKKLTYEALS